MQLVKCELLQSSVDLTLQKLYIVRAEKNAKLVTVWKASNLSRVASAEVDLNLQFPTQNNNMELDLVISALTRQKVKKEN